MPDRHMEWAENSELHGPAFAAPDTPAPKLVMFGAVPLAAAMCTVARAVGWRPYVVDPRDRFTSADRFPDAADVLVAWPGRGHERFRDLTVRRTHILVEGRGEVINE